MSASLVLPVLDDAAAMPDGAAVACGLDAVVAAAAANANAVDVEARLPVEALQAMRRAKLLSMLVPVEYGGAGSSLFEIASTCHSLGQACASSAMLFAMHQIQVACLIDHAQSSPWHRGLLERTVSEQLLMASVTSEAGTGGNIHASVCAPQFLGNRLVLEKQAPAVSYGAAADVLLITCRRNEAAAASDQLLLAALGSDCRLERKSGWNPLGMRGTCSEGFHVRVEAGAEQLLPTAYGDIASVTMLPVSHLVWSGVWLGIASDAVMRMRGFLRQQSRLGVQVPGAALGRLTQAVGLLQALQARLAVMLRSYDAQAPMRSARGGAMAPPMSFTAEMNTLKISVSEGCLEVLNHAFHVCGIAGYRNDGPFSLGRHLRDLQSAPVMISNDRIMENTASLLLLQKPALGLH